MQPSPSVQGICNLLARSQLMTPDEVRALFQLWRQEAGPNVTDTARFRQWLVTKEYVTDFQADRLWQGRTDHYFLNQYKLLDRIGQGRMAGVYKAQHKLGQVVAIKILPPSKARDPQAFARFQREARLAKRLDHPNIVRTFQTAVANGLYYLVMEYLEGETLKDVLERRGKLPVPEAIRLINQALNGLQHLCDQGMVHRDLEPGNLMLVPAPGPGQPDTTLQATVKILDIGLGRQIFDEGVPVAGGLELTTEGTLLGTPEYMAPEQARDSHAADIRSDIYSVGCILYHCLAGQSPFADKQMVRMMVRHATEPPPPLRQFNPAVPEGLQQVIERMLAKDPKQRYPLPLQAAQALEPFLGGAGSGPASDVGPRMQAYLQWLAANSREDEDTSPSPVAVAPAVASPPLPAPAGVAVPAPAPVLAPQPVAAAAPADVNLVPLATGSRANLLGILALVVTGIAGLAVAGAVGWMLVRWMLLR